MSLERDVTYVLFCDVPACSNSLEIPYTSLAQLRANGRGARWARQEASRVGWSAFSDTDKCPEHSHKEKN